MQSLPRRPKPTAPNQSQPSGSLGEAAGEACLSAAGTHAPGERYVPGQVISGKYRLIRLLGEGGMGAVWLAQNLALDVHVAIKLIRRELSDDAASERLLLEARAAARLGHPSIVRVYDFGATELGDPFIVMEFLTDGESLGEVLHRKGRLPAQNAVRMLLPVCGALSAAHAKGIVHRDLKPDNIMLVGDEAGAVVPKVVDFGIAKLRGDESAGPSRRAHPAARAHAEPRDEGDVPRPGATEDGAVVGTPDYMSPEQARGEIDIDARTDVWAVSVVLYETLTGIRPFDAPTYGELVEAILEKPPTPITDFGAGDDRLWAIVATGLEKEATLRWPTIRELGVALAGWAVDSGIETDVAGTAIAPQWLCDEVQVPSSPDSPPVSRSIADRLSSPEVRVRSPRSDPPRSGSEPPPRISAPPPTPLVMTTPLPGVAGPASGVSPPNPGCGVSPPEPQPPAASPPRTGAIAIGVGVIALGLVALLAGELEDERPAQGRVSAPTETGVWGVPTETGAPTAERSLAGAAAAAIPARASAHSSASARVPPPHR